MQRLSGMVSHMATYACFHVCGHSQNCFIVWHVSRHLLLLSHTPRWLSVRLELLGAFSTFLAAFVAVEQQGQNAALMGLLLSYALQVGLGCSGFGCKQLHFCGG